MVKLKIAALALFIVAGLTIAIFPETRSSVNAATPQETKIQGWTMPDRQTFYHKSQSTRFFMRGNGIIGPLLTDEERWAIIEYLKTR